MLKIKKLDGGQTFVVSRFIDTRLLWKMNMSRGDFARFLKVYLKNGKIKPATWFDSARYHLRYTSIPVIIDAKGNHISGIPYRKDV